MSDLIDLYERLEKANSSLLAQLVHADTLAEAARLRGKAEGVRLAISYVNEYQRDKP
jgi:chromosome segregation ATPase